MIKNLLVSLLAILPAMCMAANGDTFTANLNSGNQESTVTVTFTVVSEFNSTAQVGDGTAIQLNAENVAVPAKITNAETGKTYKVTTIGENAFANAEAATLEIPTSVTTIKAHAFAGSKIDALWIRAEKITAWGNESFKNIDADSKVFVPVAEWNTMLNATKLNKENVQPFMEMKDYYLTFSLDQKFMIADFVAYDPNNNYQQTDNTLQAFAFGNYDAENKVVKDMNVTHKIIPAYSGVLLRSEKLGICYAVKPYEDQDAETAFTVEENLLKGSGDAKFNMDAVQNLCKLHQYYVFTFKEGKYAFWRCSGGNLSMYKGYLNLGGDFGPYGIYDIDFETDAVDDYVAPIKAADNTLTAINALDEKNAENNEAWYTLQGVRLTSAPTATGIYVHKGKKIVVK